MRRELEQLFDLPLGTTEPHTEADQVIALALLDDAHWLNQSFIALAIKAWDDHGQGCFAVFIQVYVFRCWGRLARLN